MRYTARASEQAAEHPDKPEIAGKVKDVAGVHKTLWPEETGREQIIKTVKRFVVRADEKLTVLVEV